MTLLHIIESDGGTIEFIKHFILSDKFNKQIIICGERAYLAWNKLIVEKKVKLRTAPEVIYWKFAGREISILNDYKALRELMDILGRISFDSCILHSSKAGFLGRIAFFLNRTKAKVVYVPHGLAFLRKDVSKIKIVIYKLLEFVASKLSGEIICTSSSEMLSLKNIGISAMYINNGTTVIKEPVPDFKAGKDILKIVSVGRLTFQKCPSMFNFIADFFKDNNKLQFLWIGDGELRNEITSPNIQVTGRIPHEKVLEELKDCDIYLSTALWEGLPFAVLEAMAKKLPLILSDCVGNVDLVKEGVNGYIFDSTSKAVSLISMLVENKHLLENMGQESYKLVTDEFNSEVMVEKYHQYFMKS